MSSNNRKKNAIITTVVFIILIPIILRILYQSNDFGEKYIKIESNFDIKKVKKLPEESQGREILHKDKVFYKEIDHSKAIDQEQLIPQFEQPKFQISKETLRHSNYTEIQNNELNISMPNKNDSIIQKYRMQLNLLPTELRAIQELQYLRQNYPGISNLNCDIAKIDLGRPKGIRFQVYCILDSKNLAVKKCQKIQNLNKKCSVIMVH